MGLPVLGSEVREAPPDGRDLLPSSNTPTRQGSMAGNGCLKVSVSVMLRVDAVPSVFDVVYDQRKDSSNQFYWHRHDNLIRVHAGNIPACPILSSLPSTLLEGSKRFAL